MRVAVASVAAVVLATTASAGPLERRDRIVFADGGDVYLVDPDRRNRVRLTRTSARETAPRLSPDGKRIAFVGDLHGNAEIYSMEVDGSSVRRLTTNPGVADSDPAWSPDGRRIAYASGAPGEGEIHVMDADGGAKRKLVGRTGNDVEPAWSPDGGEIAFASNHDGDYDIWTLALDGGALQRLTEEPASEREPAWSPAGPRLAFVSDRDGNAEIYTVDRSNLALLRLTNDPADDRSPSWSPGAARIAFARDDAIYTMRADGLGPTRLAAGSRPHWGRAFVAPAPPRPPPRPAAAELLPELDQRAPRGLTVTRSRGRFLLGFVSATDNVGRGPLWIRGRRALPAGPMRANQLIRLSNGRVREVKDVGVVRYTWSPAHSHWHLLRFQQFELRRASDFSLVVRDRKTGFCLADHYGLARSRVASFGPPRFLGSCGKGRPDLLSISQGSSPGYTDRYLAHFHGQNVDLTGLRTGIYVLVHRANPTGRLRERTLANNAASVRLRLTWPKGRRQPPRIAVLRVCEARERC